MGQSSSCTTSVISDELSEEQIEILLSNTKFDRYALIQWYNQFRIDCPNGKLTADKLNKIYASMFPEAISTKFTEYLFDAFDKGKNGHVDFNDFLISVCLNTDKNLEKRLQFAFKLYDINKNGVVNKSEMGKILTALYDLKGVPKEKRTDDCSVDALVNRMFKTFDKDEDKELDKNEFITGCLENPNLRSLLFGYAF